MMPTQDVQYLAKFRPNPYIIMRQRFTDQDGNEIVGGAESKGEIRLWESEVHEDDGDYEMRPLNNGSKPFKVNGARFFEDTFHPFNFNGNLVTLEQREITDNYKFRGFTYLSGSDDPQEVPFEILEDVENVDENYYGPVGSDETNIRTIKLVEDYLYPGGRLNIYANYGLITFAINNFNNTVDFENNFGDALRYGPFKFVTALGFYLTAPPGPDQYRYDTVTSFPAFTSGEPDVRLYISAPEVGYINTPSTPPIEIEPTGAPDGWSMMSPMVGTLSPQGQWVWNGGAWEENPDYDPSSQSIDYLPTGDNAHLVPIEETGFDFGKFIWLKQGNPNFPDGEPIEISGDLYDITALNETDSPFTRQGIVLRGDVDDDGLLVGNNIINQIISTETTSSISYRPTYRGTYVKAFDDGIAVPTLIQQAPLSDEPIRTRDISGAIDADLYELGSRVIFDMTPTIVPGIELMPPDIAAYIGRDNGTKTLSTNIDSDLTLENLGVEIGDWNPLEGGTFTYNVPDSRDVVTENSQARKWWKYIEFRIVVSETAESEEEQESTEGDIQYHTNILYSAYFRNVDGSLEQVSFSSPYSISSPPPETNFPPPDGIGDMNLYDTFDDIPNFGKMLLC